MKIAPLFAALLALSGLRAENAPPNIEAEIKFVEVSPQIARTLLAGKTSVLTAKDAAALLRTLREKGDLVSSPTVTTRPGLRATISIATEFRHPSEFPAGKADSPAFAAKPLGLTVEVEPELLPDGGIACVVSPRVVELQGFLNYSGTGATRPAASGDPMDAVIQPVEPGRISQPVFQTRALTTTVTLRSGETILLGGLSRHSHRPLLSLIRDPRGIKTAENQGPAPEKILFFLVTLRTVESLATEALVLQSQARPNR